MDDHKPQLYADLRVKTGEYEKDGKTKNRYAEIGVLFASPHFNNMYMQIDTLPIGNEWDGRIYVNPRPQEPPKDTPTPQKSDNELTNDFNKTMLQDNLPNDDDVDKPIDMSEIKF